METKPSVKTESGVLAGRYRLVEPIGSGCSSIVYLAVDEQLYGNDVAVKIIQNICAFEDRVFKRVRKEVLISRKLNSPNIVRVYDFGRTDEGLPFAVMEYVKGVTLETLMHDTESPLSREEKVNFLSQLLEGLGCAHLSGVCHRDLKPDNIMVSEDGILKLADFGLAGVSESEYSVTRTEQSLGTPRYISPEQLRGIRGSTQSDVYAWGVLAFEMFAGEPPFASENFFELALCHLNALPPSERLQEHLCPIWLKEIILKCLNKDPAERYRSAVELKDAFDGFVSKGIACKSPIKRGLSKNILLLKLSELFDQRRIAQVLISIFERKDTDYLILWSILYCIMFAVVYLSQDDSILKPLWIDAIILVPTVNARLFCRRAPRKRTFFQICVRCLSLSTMVFLIVITVISSHFDRCAWGAAETLLQAEKYYSISLRPLKILYGVDVSPSDPEDLANAIKEMATNARSSYIVEALLQAGADVNARLSDGDTPAILYVKQHSNTHDVLMLEQDIDFLKKGREGLTILQTAVREKDTTLVSLIHSEFPLSPMDDRHNIPLGLCILGRLDVAIGSWSSSFQNFRSEVHYAMGRYKNLDGQTLLHLAMTPSASGISDIIQLIANFDSDPNVVDLKGDTPALIAAKGNHFDRIDTLISNFPDIDLSIGDKDGQTVLWYAVNGNKYEYLDLIISKDKRLYSDSKYREELWRLVESKQEKGVLGRWQETFKQRGI